MPGHTRTDCVQSLIIQVNSTAKEAITESYKVYRYGGTVCSSKLPYQLTEETVQCPGCLLVFRTWLFECLIILVERGHHKVGSSLRETMVNDSRRLECACKVTIHKVVHLALLGFECFHISKGIYLHYMGHSWPYCVRKQGCWWLTDCQPQQLLRSGCTDSRACPV